MGLLLGSNGLLSASWGLPKTVPHRPSRGLHSTAPLLPLLYPSLGCLSSLSNTRLTALRLGPCQRQALGGLAREAAVCHHHGDPFGPGLAQVLRYGEHLSSRDGRDKQVMLCSSFLV